MKKALLSIIVCLACGLTYAEDLNPVFAVSDNFDTYDIPADIPESKEVCVERRTYDETLNQYQLKLEYYNPKDFSLIKEVSFVSEHYIVRGILMFDYLLITVAIDENYYTKLYDLNGKLICDFGNAMIAVGNFGSYWFCKVAPNTIMFCIAAFESNEYEYYHLTISQETNVQSVQIEKKAAFPCPARGEVNIPTTGQKGDLRVLNLNGQVLDAQRIQEGDYQRVNTESYPAGTYIYQAGNETGKFMVE